MKVSIVARQKSIILYVLLCFIVIIGLGLSVYFLKNDNIVQYASEQFPLDGKRVYFLKKNTGLKDKNGKTIVPAGTNYVIIVPGSSESWEDFGVNGTTVGSTSIDLQPYVGHTIKIRGYHYDGDTLILPHAENLPSYYGKSWAVIHVNSIEIVN